MIVRQKWKQSTKEWINSPPGMIRINYDVIDAFFGKLYWVFLNI